MLNTRYDIKIKEDNKMKIKVTLTKTEIFMKSENAT